MQSSVVLALANRFALPVTASYLERPPGTPVHASLTVALIAQLQAIPFKFALRNAEGEQVTGDAALKGYAFDGNGPTADFQFAHDGTRYVLVAKTPKSWAGTTRTFTLRLDDGTSHTARFSFR